MCGAKMFWKLAEVVKLNLNSGVSLFKCWLGHQLSWMGLFVVHLTPFTQIIAFHIIKPTRCTNISILFWNDTLHVSDSSSVHHQEYLTVHTAMVYIISVAACKQDQDGTAVPSWSCLQAVSKPVWQRPLVCVQWKTPDDGQRNCPKHIEYHSKIKLRN